MNVADNGSIIKFLLLETLRKTLVICPQPSQRRQVAKNLPVFLCKLWTLFGFTISVKDFKLTESHQRSFQFLWQKSTYRETLTLKQKTPVSLLKRIEGTF